MQLRHFPVHDSLRAAVARLWHFESNSQLPPGDLRAVVPNGRPKLLIPLHGTLVSTIEGQAALHPAGIPIIIGMMTTPVEIGSLGSVSAIGVEFTPSAAYRLLQMPLNALTQQVQALESVIGQASQLLWGQVVEAPTSEAQVQKVQQFLWQRLYHGESIEPWLGAAIQQIYANLGTLRIQALCAELGYSRRYVDMKFAERVGISPKMFSRIVRFQAIYRHAALTVEGHPPDFYDHYYDQAHFIHEFKQFTGYAPGVYAQQPNQFGRLFYQSVN